MFIVLYHIIALHFQNSNNSESNSNNNESLLLLFWWPLESEGPVCYYHVMYAFQSEYALCSSLNVKERLPRNRRDIWSLSEYRTGKYPQRKSIIWLIWQNGWVFVYELSDGGFEPLLSHIVLCLNAFDKLQNARGESRQPVLMGNYPTCLYKLTLSVYWMVCFRWCAWHEILWPRKSCLLRRKLTRNIWRKTKQAWQREVTTQQLTRLVGSILMR